MARRRRVRLNREGSVLERTSTGTFLGYGATIPDCDLDENFLGNVRGYGQTPGHSDP